jgi:hypothetical protein
VQSCTDEEIITEYKYHEISDEFQAYTAFDSGSYWVYQKTTATINNFDTVKVTKVNLDRRFHSDNTTQGFFYDAIELTLNSSYLGLEKAETSAGSPYNNSIMNENYRVFFNNRSYYSIFIPKYPIDSVQLLGEAEGNYTNLAFHTQLEIRGKSYSEVFHTQVIDNAGQADEAVMEFFFAKEFGLVKYTKKQLINDIQINDEWVLINSILIPIPR